MMPPIEILPKPRFYCGIGSRRTPDDIILLIAGIALRLSDRGWVLRSGAAEGADSAFANATAPDRRQLFIPWRGYNGCRGDVERLPTPGAFTIAADYHPSWEYLPRGARSLHARNAHQVLGGDLNTPSEFVICWTPDGATEVTSQQTGGTGQAIRIACGYGVPVWNLQREDHRRAWEDWIDATHKEQGESEP